MVTPVQAALVVPVPRHCDYLGVRARHSRTAQMLTVLDQWALPVSSGWGPDRARPEQAVSVVRIRALAVQAVQAITQAAVAALANTLSLQYQTRPQPIPIR